MSAQTASGPTEDQVEILEYNFNKVNKHPDPTTLCLIAAEAGLTEEETQVRTQAYCILGDWPVSVSPRGPPPHVSQSLNHSAAPWAPSPPPPYPSPPPPSFWVSTAPPEPAPCFLLRWWEHLACFPFGFPGQ